MMSPGYPAEMVHFTRGLAQVGARVIGVGDQHRSALDPDVRDGLAAYIQVPNLWDEAAMVRLAMEIHSRERLHKIECLWEPGMLLAGRMREAIGISGLTHDQTIPFRDKEIMKQVLDRAGIRTPRHAKIHSGEEARAFARSNGYPLILKPIAGAGSTDTYRVDNDHELDRAIAHLGHVSEVSIEEFVEGEEFTFDTISVDGQIHYRNIAWYRPRPLQGKLHEWISPQAICLRDLNAPELQEGVRMGVEVLAALGFQTGFSHMEWYRKADGEVVFGEIGARPPGARLVDIMNYASDIDVYKGWAEAVCHGSMSQRVERKYNAAIIFKRAIGEGRIQKIEGLESLLQRFGHDVAAVELLPVGARRRDWQNVQVSDGFLVVRHPDLGRTMAMADAVGHDLRLYAG